MNPYRNNKQLNITIKKKRSYIKTLYWKFLIFFLGNYKYRFPVKCDKCGIRNLQRTIRNSNYFSRCGHYSNLNYKLS